jgi:hypothetical protein
MISWRSILGLVLVLVGVNEFYNVQVHPETVQIALPHLFIKIACCIWIGAGVFMIVKGITNKPQQ